MIRSQDENGETKVPKTEYKKIRLKLDLYLIYIFEHEHSVCFMTVSHCFVFKLELNSATPFVKALNPKED